MQKILTNFEKESNKVTEQKLFYFSTTNKFMPVMANLLGEKCRAKTQTKHN